MIDPSNGGAGVTDKPAADPADKRNPLDLDHFVPGGLWRGTYLIREALPDITYGKLMAASHVESGENVVLRSFRVSDGTRAHAWSRLSEYKGNGLVPLLDAIEADGRRIEITRASESSTLGTWLAGKSLDEKTIRSILNQILEVVAGLHERSVAHLNLKPNTIQVDVVGVVPQIKIGGLEAATFFGKEGLMSISVDPFYAPPEAVGILQHHCGPALGAWDWWSVGRILQELVLGRHILGVMLDRDVSRRTPELLMRADRVLREKETPLQRAGGVEVMPAMAPELTTLLRGLLSSSRDARWGAAEVRRWLQGEQVKERYHLSAHERLFFWKDRGFPLAEAAEYFSEASHWKEGVENIFGGGAPGTLLGFVAEDGALRDLNHSIQDLVKLPDSSAFVDIDPEVARDVMTGIALALCSDGKVSMQLVGRRIDAEYIASCLEPSAQPKGLFLVQSLTERTAIQQIGKVDVETSRFLAEFERASSAAVTLAAGHHWISRADRLPLARLLALTLKDEAFLRSNLEAMKSSYAACREEALDRLFKKAEHDSGELAVLAFVAAQADKFGFVSHEKWVAEKYQLLRDKGESLAVAATWIHLGRALRSSPHLSGPWPLILLSWLLLGAPLALAFPSRLTLGAVAFFAAAACGIKILLLGFARRELRTRIQTANTLLPVAQCDSEARRVLRLPEAPAAKVLARSLAEVRAEIRALPSKTPLELPLAPGSFLSLRWSGILSAVALLGSFVGLGYGVVKHPPTVPVLLSAWLHPNDQATLDAKKAADAKRAAEVVKEETANARKSRRNEQANDAKIAWGFRPSPDLQAVHITKVQEPTPDQNREARELGEYLARPYTPETIDNLIALRITTPAGVGLMLFDGKTGKIADKRLFITAYVPLARSWILLGDHRAIFLDDN